MHGSTVLTILENDPRSCIILRSYVFSEVFTMCIGVMVPNISSEEVAMKLAVTGTLVKQCLTVYHTISQYTTVYHSISQYITVYQQYTTVYHSIYHGI